MKDKFVACLVREVRAIRRGTQASAPFRSESAGWLSRIRHRATCPAVRIEHRIWIAVKITNSRG